MNIKKCLVGIAVSGLLVVGLGGMLYVAARGELNDKTEEIIRFDRALDAAGISRRDAQGVTRDNIIYRGTEPDVNGNGITDYRIFLKQPGGTYSERVVLGVK